MTSSTVVAARVNAFAATFPPLVALLTAPLLARGLGVDGRGEVAGAVAPLTLAMSALTLGLPEAVTFVTRRSQATALGLRRFAGLIAAFVGAVSALVVVCVVANVVPSTELIILYIVAALCMPGALVLTIVRATAAGLGDWRRVAGERITGSLVRGILIVFLYTTGQLTPFTATVVIAGTMWIGVVAYVGMSSSRRTRFTSSLPFEGGRNELVRFGLRTWPGVLAGALILRLDQLLILPLSGARQLGLYVVAVTVAEGALILNNSFRDVMFAVESGGPRPARIAQASRASTLVTGAVAAMLMVSSPYIIPAVFGRDFAESVGVLTILLLGIVVGNPGSIAGVGVAASGQPGKRSIALISACVVNVAAVVVVVPRFGAVGAAAATAAANLVAGMTMLYFARQQLGLGWRDFLVIRREDVAWVRSQLRPTQRLRPRESRLR